MTANPLRSALADAIAANGGGLATYTVLDKKADPFRLDTDARHRDGRWLADALERFGLSSQRIHLRGIHYAVLGCDSLLTPGRRHILRRLAHDAIAPRSMTAPWISASSRPAAGGWTRPRRPSTRPPTPITCR
jgi:hypothetical protein